MLIDVLVFVQRAAPAAQQPKSSTIVQAILLGLAITGLFSIFASGFTAKKIGITDATYVKAFGATVLKNLFGLAGVLVFGLLFQAPEIVAFGIAFSIIPITIYKLVFGCAWGGAVLIWLVATLVEGGIFYGLLLAGVLALRPA